jgi:hypothetical protein
MFASNNPVRHARSGGSAYLSLGALREQATAYAAGLALLVATLQPAFGNQPPDLVVSDQANNTAGGSHALQDMVSADFNTAFGAYALTNDTTGFENTAFGYNALQDNQAGIDNTAVGVEALDYSTGNYNTAAGAYAQYEQQQYGRRLAIAQRGH